MKGRLNTTIYTVVVVYFVALFAVLMLAYEAGARTNPAGSMSIVDALTSTSAGFRLIAAIAVAVVIGMFVWFRLANAVATPVSKLSDFAERFGAGDYKARLDIESEDDFGYNSQSMNK